MTPTDRDRETAERIYSTYGRKGSWNLFDKKMIDAIVSALAEAREEGYSEGIALGPGFPNKAYEEGRKAGWEDGVKRMDAIKQEHQDIGYNRGLEEAAKVAENSPNKPGAVINVDEIRLKKPFVTLQEMGDHIAKQIRNLKNKK